MMPDQLFQDKISDIPNILQTKENAELLEIFRDIIEIEPLKIKILKKIKCKKCGWCCKAQNAMLTPDDIIRLLGHFKCSYEEFYEKYLDKKMKIPYLKSPCPFLIDNKCDVYHIRPKVCKIYPFIDFLLVVRPCLLGEEILNIIIKNGGSINDNNGNNENFNNIQKLYDGRLEILNAINGSDGSNKADYHSIFINKNILGKLIKILKKN